MTDDEKINIKLDEWLAEHVMGWKLVKRYSGKRRKCWRRDDGDWMFTGHERDKINYECDHPEDEMFRPTVDQSDAMMVWDKCLDKCASAGIVTEKHQNDYWVRCQSVTVAAGTFPQAVSRFAITLFSFKK